MNEPCKFKDCIHWEILTNEPTNCENCSRYHEQDDMYQPKIKIGMIVYVQNIFDGLYEKGSIININKKQAICKLSANNSYTNVKIVLRNGAEIETHEQRLDFRVGSYYVDTT